MTLFKAVYILITIATLFVVSLTHGETEQPDQTREAVTRLSPDKPRQIHLSYTGDITSMFATWTTLIDVGRGYVTFYPDGEFNSPTTIKATMTPLVHTTIVSFGHINRTTYTYRATMQPLEANTTYYYYVRSGLQDSDTFSFKTFPDYSTTSGQTWNPRLAIYGDMGAANHVSLPKLQQDVDKNMYDLILHIGDFAYNMNGFFGAKGDIFMDLIQPVATKLPYNFCVGNHEHHNNFSEFSGRFTGPPPSVFYHSFDMGPIHFILFSAEFYFFTNFGTEQAQAQYNWIVEDLAKANTEEARAARPWIIALAHRPMYCSAINPTTACRRTDNPMRIGLKGDNGTRLYELEQLFLENGVDVQFYAHEHNYERLYPIYNYQYEKVSNISQYNDPMYPVHVITGSAGCREFRGFFQYEMPEWTVFRTNQYGFTRLNVLDRLTLQIEQYSIDDGGIVDSFTVHKSQNYPNFGIGLDGDRF